MWQIKLNRQTSAVAPLLGRHNPIDICKGQRVLIRRDFRKSPKADILLGSTLQHLVRSGCLCGDYISVGIELDFDGDSTLNPSLPSEPWITRTDFVFYERLS